MEIALIIATKDRPNSLERLLDSMKRHRVFSRQNLKVVIIDNGLNPPGTQQVCNNFPVQYFRQPIPGKSQALNKGLQNSDADYIAFIDDDVVIVDPDWIDRLLAPFLQKDKVGYVSGQVRAFELRTRAQIAWEKKGGLSKGEMPKCFDHKDFRRLRFRGFPVNKIAAGANCMISREALHTVGLFDPLLGPGAVTRHGESLDYCYRVLLNGFETHYNPQSIVAHSHPSSTKDLIKKHLIYGLGDAAIHTKFLLQYHDFRSLFELLWGRNLELTYRLIRSITGRYPLPPMALVAGLIGLMLGPWLYLYAVLTDLRQKYGSAKEQCV